MFGRIAFRSLILAALVSVAFAYALYEMMGFNPSSRLMPGPIGTIRITGQSNRLRGAFTGR